MARVERDSRAFVRVSWYGGSSDPPLSCIRHPVLLTGCRTSDDLFRRPVSGVRGNNWDAENCTLFLLSDVRRRRHGPGLPVDRMTCCLASGIRQCWPHAG